MIASLPLSDTLGPLLVAYTHVQHGGSHHAFSNMTAKLQQEQKCCLIKIQICSITKIYFD